MGMMMLFLAGSLMDFHEWRKLPELAAHFQEHRAKNPHLSLSDFLFLHYGAGADQHQQEEPLQHQQLPFGATAQMMVAFFCPQPQAPLIAGSLVAIPLSFRLCDSSLPDGRTAQAIWQPPRA